jgi:predicted DNA-binding transcriptional regulator
MARKLTEITVEEWLHEIERIESDPGEGVTVMELSEAWGVCDRVVRDMIRNALRRGWVRTTRVRREAIDGSMRSVPGYVLLRPE